MGNFLALCEGQSRIDWQLVEIARQFDSDPQHSRDYAQRSSLNYAISPRFHCLIASRKIVELSATRGSFRDDESDRRRDFDDDDDDDRRGFGGRDDRGRRRRGSFLGDMFDF